jgi:predicted Zn-dependent protease
VWRTQNQPSAVVGVSEGQDAIAELRVVQGSASAAAQQFFSTQGIQTGGVSNGTVHGFPAVAGEFAATVEGGTLRGIGSFIEYDGRTYRILTYTPADRYANYSSVFRAVHGSFDRVTDSRVLNVQPMRIRVERVSQNMTLTQYNQQNPSVVSIQELAVVNGMAANAQLTAGQMIKRVVR